MENRIGITEPGPGGNAQELTWEQLETLFDSMDDLAFWTTRSDGAGLLYINPARESLYCRSKDVFFSRAEDWLEMVHEEDREAASRSLTGLVGMNRKNDIEYRIVKPDGSVRWVHVKRFPGPDGLIFGTLTDITGRRQAEAALRRSEAHYHQILDLAPIVLFVKDLEGRYTFINHAFAECTELAKDEIIGRTDRDLFPKPVSRNLTENDLKVFESGLPLEIEEFFPVRGEIHPFDSIKFPLFTSDGRIDGLCGISIDIHDRKKAEDALMNLHQELESRVEARTMELARLNQALTIEIKERRKTEAALKKSEAYFRALFENATDLIDLLDEQGRIEYRSPSFEKAFGFESAPVIGRDVFSLYEPGANRDKAVGLFDKALQEPGRVFETEIRARHRDGSWRILECHLVRLPDNSGARGVVACSRDVTEHRKAEEALRKSEERYRRIVETAQEGILILDENDCCTLANPKLLEMSGYRENEVLGHSIYDLVSEQAVSKITRVIERNRSGISEIEEFRLPRKDGKHIRILSSHHPPVQPRMAGTWARCP